MNYFENNLVAMGIFDYKIKKLTYVHNVLIMQDGNNEELYKFLKNFNSFEHNIKFKIELRNKERHFLDINIKYL